MAIINPDDNTTPVDNDLSALKNRVNRTLNSIDSLLADLKLLPPEELLITEIPGQTVNYYGEPFPQGNIDPETGLPIEDTVEIDPLTGLPIQKETLAPKIDPTTGLPIQDEPILTGEESAVENRLSAIESKASSAESKASEALQATNDLKSAVQKAMSEAKNASNIARRAMDATGKSINRAVNDSDAGTPDYVKGR